MNELEKYRDEQAKEYISDYNPEQGYYQYSKDAVSLALKNGFNTAIALDLPIKFAEWKYHNTVNCVGNMFIIRKKDVAVTSGWMQEQKQYSFKELYQYWIENVYKYEQQTISSQSIK